MNCKGAVLTLLTLAATFAASGQSVASGWSDWQQSGSFFVRTICSADATNGKHSLVIAEIRTVSGRFLIEGQGVKGESLHPGSGVEVSYSQSKDCSGTPDLKLKAQDVDDSAYYRIEYKGGKLQAKHHDGDSMMLIGALLQGTATGLSQGEAQRQAAEDAAEQQRQEQIQEQQAAAAQRQAAEQQRQAEIQLQQEAAAARQTAANAAAAQAAAARDQQAALREQQLLAQQAAAQRARQNAAQYSAMTSSQGQYPTPRASDLAITKNYVETVCSDGTATAHYQITNNSYSNASVTIGLNYRTGGVTSSFTPTQSVPARSSQDFSLQIPCGGDPQLNDYGTSSISQWQFQ